jgi:hypothetical protein
MSFRLRAAGPEDVHDLLRLIRGLAEYERLTALLEVTPEGLARHLFGERPAAEAWVAELKTGDAGAGRGPVVGFALFFTNFSTFLGRPGLYLEDLYVEPAHRARGIGKALLKALGRLAVERGCGRFEWSVLDWNADAIGFYEAMGATVMPDWRLCRVTGEALRRFGG